MVKIHTKIARRTIGKFNFTKILLILFILICEKIPVTRSITNAGRNVNQTLRSVNCFVKVKRNQLADRLAREIKIRVQNEKLARIIIRNQQVFRRRRRRQHRLEMPRRRRNSVADFHPVPDANGE